jgi:4-amino-4-deoxy-L-arabinose transferase-like glycosyltransferase
MGEASLTRMRSRRDPPASQRRFWVLLTAIIGGGVLVRVLYTLLEAPWPPPALDDQFYFSALPKLIADGEGFVAPFRFVFDHVSVATAEHPPLYSLVLALPAKLGLSSPDAQRLAGSLFGAGTILVVGLLGRRLAGDRAGLLSAALAAVYPVLIAADGALMSESLNGLLVALMLLAAYRLADDPRAIGAVALGTLGGLALTRGEALLLLPLVLIPVLARPAGLRAAAVAVLAFAVVLTPWTVRNWVTFDRPVLVATNSGTAVAGANCDETFSGDNIGGWWPPCIREHPGNEAEHHSEALRDGVRYAGDHLGRLPLVLAARLGRVWSVYDPSQTPEGRSRRMQKLGVIVFFVLVPFAAAGAVVLHRRGVGIWIVTMPFVVVSITALATYGNMRFREPAELSVVVLAAVAIDACGRRRT